NDARGVQELGQAHRHRHPAARPDATGLSKAGGATPSVSTQSTPGASGEPAGGSWDTTTPFPWTIGRTPRRARRVIASRRFVPTTSGIVPSGVATGRWGSLGSVFGRRDMASVVARASISGGTRSSG